MSRRIASVPEVPCPNEAEHTPCPVGAWPAWWSWAEQMNRTHGQRKCEGCGRWAIWYPRAEGELAPCWGCGEAKVDPAKFGEDEELLCGGCVIEREAQSARSRTERLRRRWADAT